MIFLIYRRVTTIKALFEPVRKYYNNLMLGVKLNPSEDHHQVLD